MCLMTNTASDFHAVFAYLSDGSRVRISKDELSYSDALSMWQRIDERFQPTTEPTRVNGVQVEWFNVRSMDDPDWNSAPKGNLIWGYVAADYGVSGFFTVTVDLAVKALSPAQRTALYYAASAATDYDTPRFEIGWDTHGKTRQSLADKGLLRSRTATALGEAVARCIYKAETGKTVEQGRVKRLNEQRARKIKQAAARLNRRRRVEAVIATMPEQVGPLAERLRASGYSSLIDTPTATIRLTLDELEVLTGVKS